MRKRRILLIAILVSLVIPFETANAATVVNKTDAKLAVVNLQKLITKTTQNLRNLGESSIVGTGKLAFKYSEQLAPITSRYISDKTSAEIRVTTALADLNRKSNFIIEWDNYEACNGRCIKGSVYNFPFNTIDETDQSGFDRNVLIGVITPQDKVGYSQAREAYKIALQELAKMGDIYQTADFELRERVLAEYDSEEDSLRESLQVQKLSLDAAKKASFASRDFEINFKTAFYFKYNLDSLYLVGSSSFSEIDSFLDALNVVSASQAYTLGTGINRNYQASKALAFNKSLGSVFTSDSKFKSLYSKALTLYRSSAKK